MKVLSIALFLVLNCGLGFAQESKSFKIDSLQKQLQRATNDTTKTNLILERT
jgi:hypothetical protein